jgi:1-acyl-sn-glycerol-3-phosphate acyltransferase
MKKLWARFLIWIVRGLTSMVCRVHKEELVRLSTKGPMIMAANHVNFLDAPVMFTHLQPRPMTGFAKAETWHNFFFGMMFSAWDIIPIKRGEVDMVAFDKAKKALAEGKMLAISPEGTRSGTGVLKKGHQGIVLLALRSNSPITPIAYYGHENFWKNLSRLHRSDYFIRVGKPFQLKPGNVRLGPEVRQQMLEQSHHGIPAIPA